MPTLTSIQLKLAATLVILILGIGYSYYLFHKGEVVANATQVTNQAKQDNKTWKKYEKIDKETPYQADKSAAVDWLYNHAVGQ